VQAVIYRLLIQLQGNVMSNCRGCGTVLDPTEQEVNQGVNQILEASLKDAVKHGEICPLCGHSQAQPVSHRKSVQFGLLLVLLIVGVGLVIAYQSHRSTERDGAARDALKQIESDATARELLGVPIGAAGRVTGEVKQDETGWRELHLTIPVRGSKTTGVVRITAGRETGPWKYTTLEVLAPAVKKRADLLTGRIVEYDPGAYQELHTEAFVIPENIMNNVPPPSWDGNFPCIYAVVGAQRGPRLGTCATPVPLSAASRMVVDRFETDLRRGTFILRQTDLAVNEAGFQLPLTRTYNAQDWVPQNKTHAFGLNANHPYDIAPLGTRNPYTEQFIVLEDGDFLYLPRVSTGTGYSDAVYRHSETGTSFYKATQQWNGSGWLLKLQDGSSIRFPESYSAKNLAQGAPTEMNDAAGHKIELIRDGERNLKEIRVSDASAMKFSYDGQDRIVHAEDNRGNWTNYAYNEEGFLTDVVHSTGAARYYYYEKALLTWVRDEKGQMLVHNAYDSDWLVEQQFANDKTVRYSYDLSKNHEYALRVSITLPDGSMQVVDPSASVSDVYKRMN
jgi:YD repeat-containing protein